jgi:hypothetical protein
MWWYQRELAHKTAHHEADRDRLQELLARPKIDRQTRNRLKLELDCVEIRLTKLKRGLLY